MMKLAIELSKEQEARLSQIATRLNVPIERLAQAAVRELLAEPEAEFERIAARVLEKNQELYERLR
jgi:predicted transcriptional regulator